MAPPQGGPRPRSGRGVECEEEEKSSMCNSGGGALVDEGAGVEAVHGEAGNKRVRFAGGDGVGHCVAASGDRFKAAGAPATANKESLDRGEAHERTRVGRDVDAAGPLSHEFQAAKGWEELDDRAEDAAHLR